MLTRETVFGLLLLAACGGSPGGTNNPPGVTGTDISPSVSAPLAMNLQQSAAQSNNQQVQLAAQGAILALQGGTQATQGNINTVPTPPPHSAAPARSGALSTGAASAFAFQLTVLNVPQGASTQVVSGILVFTDAADAALAAGLSTSSAIPPGVGLILEGQALWTATSGQVSATVGQQLKSCPGAASLPAYVTACTLNDFSNAGLGITASTPLSSLATGSKQVSLPTGALVGAALTVDCSKTTLCGTSSGSVSVTLTPVAPTVQTGGNVQFSATVTGSSDTAVTWTVLPASGGGTISGTGLYTAPGTPGTYGVVATSVADTAVAQSTTVTVTSGTAPTPWAMVSAGSVNSLGVRTDGTLWTWGSNVDGELGIGMTGPNQTTPVNLGGGFAAVSAGEGFDLALTPGGILFAWGNNSSGQLGLGTTVNYASTFNVGAGYAKVSGGFLHTVAVRLDGTLWAWGDNTYGELGNGSTTSELNPTQIGTETDWATVSAGYYYSLGIKTDGTLWAWGYALDGQVGNAASTGNQTTPVQIGTGFATLSATWYSSYAVKTDGTLWAWGLNTDGALGDGVTAAQLTPIQTGTGYVSVTGCTQANTGLGVKTDGTVWTMGNNSFGQFGNGTTTTSTSPVQVQAGFASVVCGSSYVLGLKPDGSLWAWGDNTFGELGIGSAAVTVVSPVQVP